MYTIISESKIDIRRCNNQRSKYREVRKEDAMTCLVKKKNHWFKTYTLNIVSTMFYSLTKASSHKLN